jgi:hypothetical protein
MVAQPRPRSDGRVALKYGLIAGAILAAITIVVFFILIIPAVSNTLYKMFPQTIPGTYFNLLNIFTSLFVALLNMIVYFCTGLLTTKRTGKMGTAMLACLWALLCFLFADLCTLVVSLFMLLPFMSGPLLGQLLITSITYDVFTFIIDLILACVLGFGAGALGALIGKQKTNGGL